MPEISVIVPVYKAENYLHSCVDSILSQTFSDFEVILVDDGSPDGCSTICEEYAAKDSRVSVIHQENQGQAAARNHALARAKGSWISYVDSDDLIHPQMLQLLHHAAVTGEAGVSMCSMIEGTQLPEDFGMSLEDSFTLLTMDEQTLLKLYDAGQYPGWVACAKLIRRDLVEGYPFTVGRVFEDNEAVCHWVCEGKRLAVTGHGMYFYRTNPISTTQKAFSLKRLDYLWALERIIRYYHCLGYDILCGRFCDVYAQELAGYYRRTKNELKQPEKARELIRAARQMIRDGVPLSRENREVILDAVHPVLIRVYWPAAGILRRVRRLLGKGDAQ